jgi:hypothetical protein
MPVVLFICAVVRGRTRGTGAGSYGHGRGLKSLEGKKGVLVGPILPSSSPYQLELSAVSGGTMRPNRKRDTVFIRANESETKFFFGNP